MPKRKRKKKRSRVIAQSRPPATKRTKNSKRFYWLILMALTGVFLVGIYFTFIEAGGHRERHSHEFIRRPGYRTSDPYTPNLVYRGTNSSTYFGGEIQLDIIRFDESRESFEVKLEYRNFDDEVRQMLQRGRPTVMMTGIVSAVRASKRSDDVSNPQFVDLTFVPGQAVDYGHTSHAVAQFFWKPEAAHPFYYPFDYYTFDLDLEILGILKDKPEKDDTLIERDIAAALRDVYETTDLKPWEEGYRCWVLPYKVSVQLPPNLVFRNIYEPPEGTDKPKSPNFTAGRKSAIQYVSISVIVLTFLLLVAIATMASSDSLNLQSMGYVAGLVALRGFVLNDAEIFPSLLDLLFVLLFALVLIFFLGRALKERHS